MLVEVGRMTKMDTTISAASAIETPKHVSKAQRRRKPSFQRKKDAEEAMRAYTEARLEAGLAAEFESILHFGNGALGLWPVGRALRHKIQLPGENKHGFEALRASIVRDFEPQTSAEVAVLEGLARIEWELIRHRAMREHEFYGGLRAKIRVWVIERMQKNAGGETTAAPTPDARPSSGSSTNYWDKFNPVDRDEVEREVERILDIVLEIQDPDDPSEAVLELTDAGLAPLRWLGDVHREGSERIRFHEQAILELEERRSRVLRDWSLLRRSTPIPTKR
ncbi:hypothetical protein HKCCSP123_02130 [Rhodobacterales bacterium HKCCSP123]|nr:hypothetical protein [Rhodobacterales bacterium HKCCSP123]